MDIATSASPEQVMSLFDRTVATGLAHGTVTVLLGGQSFEVTTFRKESGYTDHRRPAEVQFVQGISEDLQRRDFTMNAIARDLSGELTDPYGGYEDIKRGWIRCVGKAEERFEEDALRMIRAVRFTSLFGFKPMKSLWRGLLECRDGIKYIAVERIRSELERMVLGPDPLRGFALLHRSGLLNQSKAFLPVRLSYLRELRNEELPLWDTLSQLPTEEPAQRWSLLLQALHVHADDAPAQLKAWTFPGAMIRMVTSLLHIEEAVQALMTRDGARLLAEQNEQVIDLREAWNSIELAFGKESVELWLDRESIMIQTEVYRSGLQKEVRSVFLKKAWEWHNLITVYQVSDLSISAGEVMDLSGRRGGPWLGALMKQLLELTATGKIPNEHQALAQAAKERLNDEWAE